MVAKAVMGRRLVGEAFAVQQTQRGFHVPYRLGARCPGCGKGHWYIGGQSAECAFCGVALQLQHGIRRGGVFYTTKSRTA